MVVDSKPKREVEEKVEAKRRGRRMDENLKEEGKKGKVSKVTTEKEGRGEKNETKSGNG